MKKIATLHCWQQFQTNFLMQIQGRLKLAPHQPRVIIIVSKLTFSHNSTNHKNGEKWSRRARFKTLVGGDIRRERQNLLDEILWTTIRIYKVTASTFEKYFIDLNFTYDSILRTCTGLKQIKSYPGCMCAMLCMHVVFVHQFTVGFIFGSL